MKRFILPLLLFLFTFSVVSQNIIFLEGTVTDSATGLPIVNQAVYINSDSSNGFFYYNTVYTNSNGWYQDSISLGGGTIDTGLLVVTTYDCNQMSISYDLIFGPMNMNLVQDFQICYNPPSPCQADFTWATNGTLTVQFTDLSTGTTGPWIWSFGDGTTSTSQHPLHTYPQEGYYDVTLTIGAGGTSCFDTITQTVHVIDSTGGNCVANYEAYPNVPGGLTVYFYDQSLGNINSWSWDFGDGAYGTTQNPVHTYSQPGLYNVCLTVQGVDSSCYDTYCEIVNVGGTGGCQAQFTYYPDSLQNVRLIHFMDLSYGDVTSWFWDFGDSTFSTEQNPSHMFPEEGTFYVCLTIEANNNGAICQSTWCEEVSVGGGSNCASYFTYQNNGLAISFAGHMVNSQPATYAWDFGDGQSGQGQTIVHQYAASGIYYATLTTVTTDTNGCTFSTAQSLTVGDSTQWNQVYGQVFAGNFPMNLGMVMIFSLDTTLNFLPFIDISTVDSSGIYYFPMVPLGEYLIYAIPFDPTGYMPTYYGDVIDWESATVVSLGQANNPYNINLIEAIAYNSGNGGINGQINTTGLKSPITDKITMLLMNEAMEAISFHQVNKAGEFDFTDLDYGIYYLKAELVGCQSDLIKVELTMENPIVDVVMTFTGNHILGVNENYTTMEAGVVYPNPVRDQAQISLKLSEGTQVYIKLFNLSGQRAYQLSEFLNAGPTTITIPVGQLRNGLYTLHIYTNSGLNLTRKLLKSQ